MHLTSTQEYANFRAWVPRNVLSIGVQHPQSWLFYDWGPRSYPQPLVCLHALIGSAESFFHQIIALAPRGYRVISVHIPAYWTVSEYCDAFHSFLDMLELGRIHIYAAGLGALLATQYALRKPDRIVSMVLTHALLSLPYSLSLALSTTSSSSSSSSTSSASNSSASASASAPLDHEHSSMPPTPTYVTSVVPYSPGILRWLPPFLVRSAMRALLPSGRTSTEQAHAAEFVIGQTMSESRDVLAARLALVVTASRQSSSAASQLHSSRSFSSRHSTTKPPVSIVPDPRVVTLIDTLDRTSSALAISDHVASHLPAARRAFLKEGGDFPYLSTPEDVNVHLIVHLRRHAPSPSSPMPTPPPAKRRPLPVSAAPPTSPPASRDQSADTAHKSSSVHDENADEAHSDRISNTPSMSENEPGHNSNVSTPVSKKVANDIIREEDGLKSFEDDSDIIDLNTERHTDPLGGATTNSTTTTATSTSLPADDNSSIVAHHLSSPEEKHIDGVGDAVDIVGGAGYLLDEVADNDPVNSINSTPKSSSARRVRQQVGAVPTPMNTSKMSPHLVGRGPTPFRVPNVDESDVVEEVEDKVDVGLLDGVEPSDPLAGSDAVVVGDEGKEKREAFISWKGVLPQNGEEDDYDVDIDDQAEIRDGWEQFRRNQIVDMEFDNQGTVANSNENDGVDGDDELSSQNIDPPEDVTVEEIETEEQKRLRLWSMSAVTASKSAIDR